MTNPLTLPCCHSPTAWEKRRDPEYSGCSAAPGEPCTWARRFDGLTNPTFHAERLEAFAGPAQVTDEAFDRLVLESGLV